MTATARLDEGRRLLLDKKWDQAAAALSDVLRQQPTNPVALNLLGAARERQGQLKEAVALMERSLVLRPDESMFHHNVGALYRIQGRFDDAEESYRTAIRLQPDYAEAYFNLSAVRKFAADDPLHAEIDAQLARDGLNDEERGFLHFAAGKLQDELGNYDRAFAHYERGNAARGATFDFAEEDRFAAATREVFTRELLTERRGEGFPGELPIFVIGMPRSGTTLVEQILASHPQVYGAGEQHDVISIAGTLPQHADGTPYPECVPRLPPIALRGFGEAYVKRMRTFSQTADRVVDKMPSNYRFLGLIALLLPRARVIHCRRDPLDTCLSCYFQRFGSGQEFSFDLGDLGRYYRRYRKLMQHWLNVLPAPPLEVDYEQLIAEPETNSRRLIEFAGLEWDPACLEFHAQRRAVRTASNEQVRRPIYKTSLARWKRYEKHLGPLRESLEADD